MGMHGWHTLWVRI